LVVALFYSETWSSWDLDSAPIVSFVAAAVTLIPVAADLFASLLLCISVFSVLQVHISDPILVLTVTVQKHEMKGVLEENLDVCFVILVVY